VALGQKEPDSPVGKISQYRSFANTLEPTGIARQLSFGAQCPRIREEELIAMRDLVAYRS
jgi:hypothetical protein